MCKYPGFWQKEGFVLRYFDAAEGEKYYIDSKSRPPPKETCFNF